MSVADSGIDKLCDAAAFVGGLLAAGDDVLPIHSAIIYSIREAAHDRITDNEARESARQLMHKARDAYGSRAASTNDDAPTN